MIFRRLTFVFVNMVIIKSSTILCLLVFSSISFCQNHIKRNEGGSGGGSGFNNFNSFFDDQLCLANFDISEGSIIRTKDSLALGAKYINVSELGSSKAKDDCLRLCCKTPRCNVITFEEKRAGSCYMFDCGSVENFLCKFTDQGDFMSAILRKPISPPPMPQNRHEAELSQLRNNEMEEKVNSASTSILNSPNTGEVEENLVKPKPINSSISSERTDALSLNRAGSPRCSRYQFECKSSGECIGIYNACDGISQCPDGSDEAAELNCPSVNGSPTVVMKGQQQQQSGTLSSSPFQASSSGSGDNNGSGGGSTVTTSGKSQQHQSQEYRLAHPLKPQQQLEIPSGGPGSNYNGHAEKNGNIEMQSQGNPNNIIFNHKDGGLMEDSFGNQLLQQRQNNPYNYWKSYDYGTGELPLLGGGAYNQGPVPFPQHQGANSPFYGGNNPNPLNVNYNSGGQVKYPSYGDVPPVLLPYNNPSNSANNPQPQQIFPLQNQQYYTPNNKGVGNIAKPILHPSNVINDPVTALNPSKNGGQQLTMSPPKTTTIKPTTSTMPTTPPTPNSEHPPFEKIDSKKLEDQILQSLLNKASLPAPHMGVVIDDDVSQADTPGPGAVLAFIAGIAMSVIMVVIVTCRLRKIRMSSRRRGKNRLDPDYLVDGMYL